MKEFIIKGYEISELTGSAKENALDYARKDMYELDASEINAARLWFWRKLNLCAYISAAELKALADEYGYWCGFDMVEHYIERTRMHGVRDTDYVSFALCKEADYLIKNLNSGLNYEEKDIIEHADANGWYFDENGKFLGV